METKTLLTAIISFIAGALLVSIAAQTFNKPSAAQSSSDTVSMSQMNDMDERYSSVYGKSGDEFDKAFLEAMIEHHWGAINMAKLSEENAKHPEIKQLSRNIISAQQTEIDQMESWRENWGYPSTTTDIDQHMPAH